MSSDDWSDEDNNSTVSVIVVDFGYVDIYVLGLSGDADFSNVNLNRFEYYCDINDSSEFVKTIRQG